MVKPSTALVKRQAGAMVLNPLSVAAVRALVNTRGHEFVLQQATQGFIRLSSAAYRWLTSAPTQIDNAIAVSNAPAAVGVSYAGNAKFQGDIRIRHRELIATTSSATSGRNYRVNPADNETFPYLSTIARNYDEYKFHSIKFGVISGAPATTAGRWYIAWDPDSSDVPPLSSQAMMATRHSLSASVWQSGELAAGPQASFKYAEYFVDDLKDHGQFQLISTTTDPLDLYVEYDVTLRNPESGSSTATIGSSSNVAFTTTGAFTPLGSEYVRPINPPVPRAFELARGMWKVDCYTIGTGLTMSNSTITNATQSKERRANFSTTESWTTIIVSNTQNFAGPCQVVLGGTWSTITGCIVTVTPLTVSQYTLLFNSMP